MSFLAILRLAARDYGIEFSDEEAEYLVSRYFRNIRPLRSCYPFDIMQQLVNIVLYERKNR